MSDTYVPSSGWLRARRILASVLVVLATLFLGVMLGKYLARYVQESQVKEVFGISVEWGLAGIGVTYLLASMEKVLRVANTFREYIAKPDKKVSLYPDCAALAFIAAYITVVALAFNASDGSEDSFPSARVILPKEIVYLSRARQLPAIAVEYVPFHFEQLAAGDRDPTIGTTLSSLQVDSIKRLVVSLKACVGDMEGQDVVLDVRGYADTNEFPLDTIEQNRKTANRRAAAVHGLLGRLIGSRSGPSGLILKPLMEWPVGDPTAMTRERYFNTRPLEETALQGDQGLFNRRADILILDLGVCERLNPE